VKNDAPLALVLAVMLLLGVYLRCRAFDVPQELRWDEYHYVDTARGYLSYQYSDNDHPPLGKLIIAGVMHFVGDTPVGWRLASLICGFANVALVAWITWTTFRSRRAAWLAAAFVAADGFFIAYSRAGLLDGMIVAFAAAGVGTILVSRRAWQVALAGFFVGCAASFKLNGVPFVIAAAALCLVSRRTRPLTPVLLLMAAAVFYAQSALPLAFSGRPYGVAAVIAENRKLIHQHLSYTVVHPMSSHWYTWFLPVRPIFLRRDVDPVTGAIEALMALGNPLLWWASTLAVAGGLAVLARAEWRKVWAQLERGAPAAAESPVERAPAAAMASEPMAAPATLATGEPLPGGAAGEAMAPALATGQPLSGSRASEAMAPAPAVLATGEPLSGTAAAALATPARPATDLDYVLAVPERASLIFGVLLAWAGPLAFWVPSLRDAYIYHYLPSYTFALVLLAGFVDRFYTRRQLAMFIAVVVVAVVSIFYAPIWGELPISKEALDARLFFPFWR